MLLSKYNKTKEVGEDDFEDIDGVAGNIGEYVTELVAAWQKRQEPEISVPRQMRSDM